MRKLLIPFLAWICLLFSLSTAAQKNFQPGYVVLRSGDTLRGQIDFREWGVSPRSIIFQRTQAGPNTIYVPSDLLSFSVAGEMYAGYTVRIYPLSLDPVVVVSEAFSSTPYEKSIFMRMIVGGMLNLYYFKDSTSTEYYFLARGNEQPFQLRVICRVAGEEGHKGVVYDDFYKSQLKEPLGDCAGAVRQLSHTSYARSALQKLIFSYNHCGKDTLERPDAKDRGKVKLSPVVGFYTSKAAFKGSGYDLAGMQFPSYTGVTGGIGVLFVLPRNREQFAFATDVLYQHFHSQGSFVQENSFINTNALLDYNLVKLDILFRYTLPTESKLRPFIQAGMANAVLAGNKSHQDFYNNVDNSVSRQEVLQGAFRSYQQGFLLGAGLTAGRFTAEARYERSTGVSDLTNVNSPVKSFYFFVGFSL